MSMYFMVCSVLVQNVDDTADIKPIFGNILPSNEIIL